MQEIRNRVARALLPPAVVALCASGCATQAVRVGQFDAFAQAGVAYVDTIPPLLDSSFVATANADSAVLLSSREPLSAEERQQELATADDSLRNRIQILNSLKKHAGVLRSYFVTIQSLAASDAESSGLAEVADGLVQQLDDLGSSIGEAKIGGQELSHIIRPTINFVIGDFQRRALEAELEMNSRTIERELALQAAALAAIAESMRADLESSAQEAYREDVQRPFVKEAPSAKWSQKRLELLQWEVNIAAADSAHRAAKSLHESFVALVENRLGSAGVAALFQDISAVLDFVDGL